MFSVDLCQWIILSSTLCGCLHVALVCLYTCLCKVTTSAISFEWDHKVYLYLKLFTLGLNNLLLLVSLQLIVKFRCTYRGFSLQRLRILLCTELTIECCSNRPPQDITGHVEHFELGSNKACRLKRNFCHFLNYLQE